MKGANGASITVSSVQPDEPISERRFTIIKKHTSPRDVWMCDDEDEFLPPNTMAAVAKENCKEEDEKQKKCKVCKANMIKLPRHGKCSLDVGTWTPKEKQKDGKVYYTSQ